MIDTILENELYKSAYQTCVLLVVLALISLVTYIILIKGLKLSANKNKLKMRIVYVSSVFFVVLCAKIWVQGFTQIFYGLSLVSAGLVITNKESIMNLVGWGIISWRGVFSEGDFIEIAGASGIVYDLGILYFKLLEASPSYPTRSSGKFIKVPNGTVITHVVKRFSLENHVIDQKMKFLIPVKIYNQKLKKDITENIKHIIGNTPSFSTNLQKIKKDAHLVKTYVYQPPCIHWHYNSDKPEYYELDICYFCKSAEADAMNHKLWDALTQFIPTSE